MKFAIAALLILSNLAMAEQNSALASCDHVAKKIRFGGVAGAYRLSLTQTESFLQIEDNWAFNKQIEVLLLDKPESTILQGHYLDGTTGSTDLQTCTHATGEAKQNCDLLFAQALEILDFAENGSLLSLTTGSSNPNERVAIQCVKKTIQDLRAVINRPAVSAEVK